MPAGSNAKRERQYEHIKDSARSRGASPQKRGGQRSGTNRPKGLTKEQLYNEAKKKNIRGRSTMTKKELADALGR